MSIVALPVGAKLEQIAVDGRSPPGFPSAGLVFASMRGLILPSASVKLSLTVGLLTTLVVLASHGARSSEQMQRAGF